MKPISPQVVPMIAEQNGVRAPDATGPCILAIDDEEANLHLLSVLLKREGYPPLHITRDPRQALELFEALRPDLVLLDLHMPGMDGFAVMEQIRRSPCATGYLPILMLTGDHSTALRLRALAGGATDFVLKPFDAVEVRLRIRNLLETRRLHATVREQNARLEEMVRERTRELEVALARAEAAKEAKSHFLAKMSHELRTPLNPIRGALELLSDGASGRTTRLLQMAARNVDRMSALIDDILYLQSIEQGNVRPESYPVHLKTVIREAVEGVVAQAERSGLQVTVEAPTTLPPVTTDALLLMEVLRRLLDNALRFTQEGGVTVRVVVGPGEDTLARVDVRDTGIGIPNEQISAVFEPFEQGDNSSTRRYEGAGLGLSICRALCKLMGYRLVATSTPGEGSTFSILPDSAPSA